MTFKKAALSLVIFFLASSVYAGMYYDADLEITLNEDGSGMAVGNLQAVRSSDDPEANIGCGFRVEKSEDDVVYWAFCQANNEEGVTVFCSTVSPELIEPLKLMSGKSWIVFNFDANGDCTKIGASNQSMYQD